MPPDHNPGAALLSFAQVYQAAHRLAQTQQAACRHAVLYQAACRHAALLVQAHTRLCHTFPPNPSVRFK